MQSIRTCWCVASISATQSHRMIVGTSENSYCGSPGDSNCSLEPYIELNESSSDVITAALVMEL